MRWRRGSADRRGCWEEVPLLLAEVPRSVTDYTYADAEVLVAHASAGRC
jgi:hypothetical protein